MALDELQDQKSFGAHWSRLGDVRWNKKHCGPFQEQFPCKLQVIIKKTFQVPWEFKAYFGEWISSFVRYGENNIFSKRSKHWRGFPSTGCLCLDDIKSSETTLQESANKVDSLSSWGAKHWRWYTNYLRKIFPAYHGQSRSQSPSFNIQVRGQDISNSENLYIYISGFSRVYTSTKYTKTAARKACYAKRRRRTHPAGNKASVLVQTRITQNNG